MAFFALVQECANLPHIKMLRWSRGMDDAGLPIQPYSERDYKRSIEAGLLGEVDDVVLRELVAMAQQELERRSKESHMLDLLPHEVQAHIVRESKAMAARDDAAWKQHHDAIVAHNTAVKDCQSAYDFHHQQYETATDAWRRASARTTMARIRSRAQSMQDAPTLLRAYEVFRAHHPDSKLELLRFKA